MMTVMEDHKAETTKSAEGKQASWTDSVPTDTGSVGNETSMDAILNKW